MQRRPREAVPGAARTENPSVRNGRWGEEVATEILRREGYEILDRNVRPVKRDQRLEIDIIAYDPGRDLLVFVEVKQHKDRSDRGRRLRSVDRRKKRLLKTACRSWLATNRWHGSFRFDVVEVYGEPGSGKAPETDHIERVQLFAPAERFVNWAQ